MIYAGIFLYTLFLFIFLNFSGYWIIIFIKRIYFYRRYKISIAKCISENGDEDESVYKNKQIYYNFETQIWKYFLLLLINLSEVISCIFLFISDTIQHYLTYNQIGNNTLELPFTDCLSYNGSIADKINIIYAIIPFPNGLATIGKSAELFLIAFSICLMNYLIIRIKYIRHSKNKVKSRIIISVTTLLSALLILTRFFPFTSVISVILFLFCSIIYFCIFVHTSNRLKSALFQRALQCLTQQGCNKDEMKQYKYFKYNIHIVCLGYLLLIISENLLQIPGVLTSTFFYRECFFPVNLIPSITSVMKSEKVSETLLKVIRYTELAGRIIGFTAIVLILSPFVLITVCIWIRSIHKNTHAKKIKYSSDNMNMQEPFIINY